MLVKKFIKSSGAFIVVGMLLSNTVFASTGTVTGSSVRIRKNADSKSIEVSLATKGEKVEVIGEEGSWYHVKFENVTGYISKEYVNTDYTSENKNETSANNISSNETSSNKPETTTSSNENSEDSTTKPENSENNASSSTKPENSEKPSETTSNDENTNSDNNSETENKPEHNNEVSSINTKKYEKDQTIKLERDVDLKYLPSFTSRVQSTAKKDSTYTVQAELNNWIKIKNDDNGGWVLKANIEGESSEPISNESNSNDNQSNTEQNPPEQNSSEINTSSDETSKPEPSVDEIVVKTKGKVNVKSAVIRTAPNGNKLGSLPQGTEVTIISEENDWYKIKTDDYESCYVAKRLITKK